DAEAEARSETGRRVRRHQRPVDQMPQLTGNRIAVAALVAAAFAAALAVGRATRSTSTAAKGLSAAGAGGPVPVAALGAPVRLPGLRPAPKPAKANTQS